MTEFPRLPDEHLSIVVFGPGYGESIAVRVPPGDWIVVDSILDSSLSTNRNPVLRLLTEYDEEPKAVVLTHPHQDHAAGFEAYVERWPNAIVGCVPIYLRPGRDALADPDAERARQFGSAETALAAIEDAWEMDPHREWKLAPQSSRTIGAATVTALGPAAATVRKANAETDPNRLSAPLAIDWRGTRIVLGADLPGAEWRYIEKEWADVAPGQHRTLKVPHHGSTKAIDKRLGKPPGLQRDWIVAPWKRAGGNLPSFADSHGIARILTHVEEVVVTALPLSSKPPAAPATRRQVHDALQHGSFGTLTLTYEEPDPGTDDAWAVVTYSDDGSVGQRFKGAAAITVIA